MPVAILYSWEPQFKEFVVYKTSVQIPKYSYHDTGSNQLVFRYDNALDPAAKHLPTYPHHKHLANDMIESAAPRLSDVLQEISLQITRQAKSAMLVALEKKYDAQFRVVFDAIRQMMDAPKKPRRRIGFRTHK